MFITEEQIENRLTELADMISNDYAGKQLILLIVLKGSVFFAVDLIRKLKIESSIEVISAKSYGDRMESSGKVNLFYQQLEHLKGKDVLIIEDIVDTGHTMDTLTKELMKLTPASLEVASFFSKPSKREVDVKIKYIGLEIPPAFIVGYGLDFAEKGRELKGVYSLVQE
jgi:hypoxanthine phosphoribosyltransferase